MISWAVDCIGGFRAGSPGLSTNPHEQIVNWITNLRLLLRVFTDPQHRQEGFLRDVHLADPLHPFLAFLLFFQ